MKKKSIFMVMAMMLCGIFAGCHGNKDGKPSNKDSVEVVKPDTLTAEEEKVLNDSIKDFLTDMYNRMLFQEDSFLTYHCSEAVMKKLKDDYAAKYKGEGIAYWDFRSDKDGDSDRYRMASITVEPNHWFKYTFYDMGVAGMHRVRILAEPDKLVIDSLE